MALLTQNSKIARSKLRTFNFGIPAAKTCPMRGACASGCYALQGFYNMPNVKESQELRLSLTKRPWFGVQMMAEIDRVKAQVVRVHDSGDFYSSDYFDKWMAIAGEKPHVTFYAYTKMVEMVKGKKLPKNFKIIFSFGGKQDHLIDIDKDRHSRVFASLRELKKAGYVDTSFEDSPAWKSKSNKIGLVYHGIEKRNKF